MQIKLFMIIIVSSLFISCTSAHSKDDGTNNNIKFSTKVNSDDGTNKTASQSGLSVETKSKQQREETPLQQKSISAPKKETTARKPDIKEEIPRSAIFKKDSATSSATTVSSVKNLSEKTYQKESFKNFSGEKEESTSKTAVSSSSASVKVTAEKKDYEPDAKAKSAVSPKKSEFFYPVSDFTIIKDFSDTGNSKSSILELKVGKKEEIKPSSEGFVIFAGKQAGFEGNLVVILHNEKYLTTYSNLTSITVKKGDYIRDLDKTIGYADNSFSFSLRRSAENNAIVSLDPKKFLQKRRK